MSRVVAGGGTGRARVPEVGVRSGDGAPSPASSVGRNRRVVVLDTVATRFGCASIRRAVAAQSRSARLARATVTTTGTRSILSFPNSDAYVRGLVLGRRAPVAVARAWTPLARQHLPRTSLALWSAAALPFFVEIQAALGNEASGKRCHDTLRILFQTVRSDTE